MSRANFKFISSYSRLFLRITEFGTGIVVRGLAARLMVLAVLAGLLYSTHALDMSALNKTFRQMGGSQQNFSDWQTLLQENANLPVPEKLKRVNSFFNRRLVFMDDQSVWGQSDYWATPMQALAKGRGDCEDYVVAKYFTLLSVGVPNNALRLVYVKARVGGASSTLVQAHMVLAYYPSADAEPLLLDNLVESILPAGRRSDLQPVFSFNSQGIFAGISTPSMASKDTRQISRWEDLLQRVQVEGFQNFKE